MMPDPKKIASKIVKRFNDHGYIAFFAGGWVRDLLLGEASDEIDIATNAPPEKILTLFPKTIPVGVAFGVVIVIEEGVQFEVSTFRKDHPYLDGRHPDGVDFSTPEKDALRRDFTINGMFFDPLTETLYDYVEGQKDLKAGIIRAIGKPEKRFEEDRLRMLRAIRFSARFGFEIEKETLTAIARHANTLFPAVSMERVWQELSKMTQKPRFDKALLLMQKTGLLQVIFPLFSLSEEQFKPRLSHLPYFPLETPPIVYLLELFPSLDKEQREHLCRYLKTSHHDIKISAFFYESEKLFQEKEVEPVRWVHFYAHPLSPLFLSVQLAKHLPPERLRLQKEHEERKRDLKPHIDRHLHQKPLVSAHLLKAEGVPPGPLMGELLKEAERLAVKFNLLTCEETLAKLKHSSLWNRVN